jgi:hypothetical protein
MEWERFSKTLRLLKMSEYFLLVGQILCPTNDELREGVAFGLRTLQLAAYGCDRDQLMTSKTLKRGIFLQSCEENFLRLEDEALTRFFFFAQMENVTPAVL